jgi:TonB family protein
VVTVRVLVDENGQVAQVEQSGPRAGLGFDRAAVEAAQESRWQAATKDDRAVKMWVDLRLEFRPED